MLQYSFDFPLTLKNSCASLAHLALYIKYIVNAEIAYAQKMIKKDPLEVIL